MTAARVHSGFCWTTL